MLTWDEKISSPRERILLKMPMKQPITSITAWYSQLWLIVQNDALSLRGIYIYIYTYTYIMDILSDKITCQWLWSYACKQNTLILFFIVQSPQWQNCFYSPIYIHLVFNRAMPLKQVLKPEWIRYALWTEKLETNNYYDRHQGKDLHELM